MPERFIDTGPKVGLRQYAALLSSEGFDAEKITRMAQALIFFYRANVAVRAGLRESVSEFLAVERRWYESLDEGAPDYTIYDDPAYLADVWACWVIYSRGYLRTMDRAGLLDEYAGEPVLDLGCGTGHTTAALADLLPGSPVTGTQLRSSPQWRIAARMSRRHGFRLTDQLPVRASVVFASEFFEHFRYPVAELRAVLACRPRALFVANTFGPRSTGHFDTYMVDGEPVPPRRASRAFDAELVAHGYVKVATTFWNGRPTYWRKSP